jgi:hypothetical protein
MAILRFLFKDGLGDPIQNSELVFDNTTGVIMNKSCLKLLQAIRSAYYENSGEYRCEDQITHSKKNIQCIEVHASVDLLVVSLEVMTTSRTGSGGACIDFSTNEAVCYEKNTNAGFIGGVGFAATFNFKVRCPSNLKFISNYSGLEVCFPVAYFFFCNLWPEYCIVTQYLTDKGVFGPMKNDGYHLDIGKVGFGLRFQGFRVQPHFMHDVSITESGLIYNLPDGVSGGGFSSLDSAYSYVLVMIISLPIMCCLYYGGKTLYSLCSQKKVHNVAQQFMEENIRKINN